MELLDLLAQQKHCNYISDLRFLQKNSLNFQQLKGIELATYSDREWIEAAFYVHHRKCTNAEQARQLLIG